MANSTSNVEVLTPRKITITPFAVAVGNILLNVLTSGGATLMDLVIANLTYPALVLRVLTNNVLLPVPTVSDRFGDAYGSDVGSQMIWGTASVTVSGGSGSTTVGVETGIFPTSYVVMLTLASDPAQLCYLGYVVNSETQFSIYLGGIANGTYTVAYYAVGY